MPPDLSGALNAYVASMNEASRPEAIRTILADWLSTHGFMKREGVDHPEPTGPATDAVKAMEAAVKAHKRKKTSPV